MKMNKFMNFIKIDEVQYIIVAVIILILGFLLSLKYLYDKENKPGSSLKITLTMFILFMVAVSGYIIVFGKDITDANRLSTIASFTSPFIAFSGAYLIFEFGQAKSDREKKLENNKKLEYKKLMLFNLLDYTIVKTKAIYEDLNYIYSEDYKYLFELLTKHGLENKLTGDLYEDCIEINSLKSMMNLNQFNAAINDLFNDKYLREYRLYEHVYDKNWTSYLDCIQSIDKEKYIENIQNIITWLTLLENSKVDKYNFIQIDSIEFVIKRRKIDEIINKLAPEIKEKGSRKKE